MQESTSFDVVSELTHMIDELSATDSRITTDWKQDGANTMMLIDGEKTWRALEVYRFIWKLQWVSNTVTDIVRELVLPLQEFSPPTFRIAITRIKTWKVFWEKQKEWEDLLDTL